MFGDKFWIKAGLLVLTFSTKNKKLFFLFASSDIVIRVYHVIISGPIYWPGINNRYIRSIKGRLAYYQHKIVVI